MTDTATTRAPRWAPYLMGDNAVQDNPPEIAATGEPTIAEAARMLRLILASGAVARLDLLHDALVVAHRRGRLAERAEVERLALDAVESFSSALADRCDVEFRRDARAWCEQ